MRKVPAATVDVDVLAYRRGIDDGFDCHARARVSTWDPGCYSGPVEACYPAEGGEIEFQSIDVAIGPSTGAQPNPIRLDADEFDRWFHDLEDLQIAIDNEARGYAW